MSDINGRYKQILEDLEKNINNPEELEFVKGKFTELSMLFMDIIDRITNLTDDRMKKIDQKQQELFEKLNSVQSVVNGIENDIYEDDDNYEFEIVCPYCNYEFATDIEEDDKEEIQCPECHNVIELDWNCEEETSGCSGSCSRCSSECMVSEEETEYIPNMQDNTQKQEKKKSNKKQENNQDEDEQNVEDDDM